jgi:hypothetical protein
MKEERGKRNFPRTKVGMSKVEAVIRSSRAGPRKCARHVLRYVCRRFSCICRGRMEARQHRGCKVESFQPAAKPDWI